jgi:hypothetical protein
MDLLAAFMDNQLKERLLFLSFLCIPSTSPRKGTGGWVDGWIGGWVDGWIGGWVEYETC